MKTVFQFLKPYRRLCVFTILAMLLDVAGGLLVPRLTADMINIGVKTGNMEYIIEKGIAMLAVTILAGAGALIGSWLCVLICPQNWERICAMPFMRNRLHFRNMTSAGSEPAL